MIRTGLIASAVAVALMLGIVAWAWSELPATGLVPVHWNAEGQADRFAGRDEAMMGMLIAPAAALLLSALLAGAPFIDPFRRGLKQGRQAYLAIWVSLLVLMTLVTAGTAILMVRSAAGEAELGRVFARFVIAATALLFVVIGNYLPKTRQSFTLGIRTPWTLTSAIAWEKTHRLGSRLFIAVGLFGAFAAFAFKGVWVVLTFVGALLAVVVLCFVYSYFVWRTAPDRNEGPRFES